MQIVKKELHVTDSDETTFVITRREIAIIHSVLYIASPLEVSMHLHHSVQNRAVNAGVIKEIMDVLDEALDGTA